MTLFKEIPLSDKVNFRDVILYGASFSLTGDLVEIIL
jgi:hypothetical protein